MDGEQSTQVVVIGAALFATLSHYKDEMLSCVSELVDKKVNEEKAQETAKAVLDQIAMAVEFLRKAGIDDKRLKEVFVEYDKKMSADLKRCLEAMHAAKFN